MVPFQRRGVTKALTASRITLGLAIRTPSLLVMAKPCSLLRGQTSVVEKEPVADLRDRTDSGVDFAITVGATTRVEIGFS